MSDQEKNEINKAIWHGKVGMAAIWTAMCGFVWFFLLMSMASAGRDPMLSQEQDDAALGMAACLTTGCMGGVWLMGLLAVLTIYAIFRRE